MGWLFTAAGLTPGGNADVESAAAGRCELLKGKRLLSESHGSLEAGKRRIESTGRAQWRIILPVEKL